MKNIAVIPFHNRLLNNKLFEDSEANSHHDNLMVPYSQIKELLKEYDVKINTIDLYDNYEDIDIVLFFRIDYRILYKLLNSNKLLIYYAWEPEVVDNRNSGSNIRKLLSYFDAIFTWNDIIVDDKRILKINYPYYFFFQNKFPRLSEFKNKKLLVNISGNKISFSKNELYSERARVIHFFEKNYPNEFELYGTGWPDELKVFKGSCKNKSEKYGQFKFALSFENMQNIDGYITEKIFDCFTSGIVPIYWGARNIDKYIPKNCYISFNGTSIEELRNSLRKITYLEYLEYLYNIKSFLESDATSKFKPEFFVNQLISCTSTITIYRDIHLGKMKLLYCRFTHTISAKFRALVYFVGIRLRNKELLR